MLKLKKMNDNKERKTHWNNIYSKKQPHEVGWTQEAPEISLQMIKELNLPKDAKIIDIGGGESKLVDNLIKEGYTDITILDISEIAIEKSKKRLGENAKNIKWIVSDILEFNPTENYDLWHDRATFHFLIEENQINHYFEIVKNHVNGHLVIGTFSDEGPEKCSGLIVNRYTKEKMTDVFKESFNPNSSISKDHITPMQTSQHYIFCRFEKK